MASLVSQEAIALGVGAFAGAMSRHQAGKLMAEWIATDPNRLGRFQGWHTALINCGGSFLLGCVSATPLVEIGTTNKSHPMLGLSNRAKLLLGVGFCGSFTTFSTFSVDVVKFIEAGRISTAASYIMANNLGGFLAAGIGMAIVRKLLAR